jgi:hypothetical protein
VELAEVPQQLMNKENMAYIYIYKHTYTYMCIYIYIYIHICVYTHTHTHRGVFLNHKEKWNYALLENGWRMELEINFKVFCFVLLYYYIIVVLSVYSYIYKSAYLS